MKIRTRLILGIGLLFAMIVLLAAISIFQIRTLAEDSRNILQDNYNSLDYSRNMLIALDNLRLDPNAQTTFADNLDKQLHNISEPGEALSTQSLKSHYNLLIKSPGDSVLPSLVRQDLLHIMEMNMSAIERKSSQADSSAKKAVLWISIAGTITFLIAFTMLINLPANISETIEKLTERIRQIGEGNYAQRIQTEGTGELTVLANAFNLMAERLEEYQNSNLEKLLFEKKRIETLINNLTDPVIGMDQNRKIIFINQAACKILGLKEQEVIHQQAPDIALHNDLIRSLLADADSGKGNARFQQREYKIHSEGREAFFTTEVVNVTVVPYGESSAINIGDVILLRDVTSFKELDLAKTNFISTVSHELKTPISSIKMSIQLLEDTRTGILNDEQQHLITSVKEDAERLLKITSELLNISQVESGKIQVNLVNTRLEEIITYAMLANQIPAELKRIRISMLIPDPDISVLADPEKTAWVLTNLLSNAVRYSHEGSEVTVQVSTGPGTIRISVRDHGSGIAPEYLEKIFHRYFRIPGSMKEGTGLGLAISKEFLEAQGARIWVESEIGKGSTFYIEYPGIG